MSYDSNVTELRLLFESRENTEGLDKLGGLTGLAKKLNVDLVKGIDESSVASRVSQFGENRIPERPPKSYMEILKGALEDFTIIMLMCAAVASILVCLIIEKGAHLCWIEGLAIIITVILVSNVAALQDYQKEQQFRKLNADVENIQINVIRGGQNISVSKYEIVVGDIVRLSIGDILEGDGVLVEGYDVETDESALTGEPILIKKTAKAPFMFSGSSLQNGQGTFMVIAVGVNSEKGRITALVRGQKVDLGGDGAKEGEEGGEKKEEEEEEEEETQSLLTMKLDKTANLIGVWALRVAGIAFLGMAINYFLFDKAISGDSMPGSEVRTKVIDWVITCITIVVVAVPEGLPLAVTLSLSLSVKKMQKDMCLVKQLDSTETMGSATSICTDKTGTLTQNRMTVVKCYVGSEFYEQAGKQTCGQVLAASGKIGEAAKEALCKGICVNKAEAEIEWVEASQRWRQKGNKTDCALLAFSHDLGVDYRVVDFKMASAAKLYPFSSARKRAGIVVPFGSKYRVYVKGASEIVLSLCNKQIDAQTDAINDMSDADKRSIIEKVVTPFAKQSLRTIALAYREVDTEKDWAEQLSEEEAVKLTGQKAETFLYETELTLVGLVGIEDPLRDTVPAAIQKCNNAGVDVRMVTGDNIDTAVAISKQCGILRPTIDLDAEGNPVEFSAMAGPDFRARVIGADGKINQPEFDKIWPKLRVLARSSPTDKYVLVSGIIESDLFEDAEKVAALNIYPDRQVVAVTGDGTNDAPALKRADVGFVMGIEGTSVAKDAADIIIMDDDFASIVQACLWGRNVYDCISKFLQFQLTVNIVAVSLATIGAFVDSQSPLRAVQMLWVNLIMDSLGALALASEPPTPELLERPPYGRNKPLLSFQMRFNMFGQAFYQLVVLMILLFGGAGEKDPEACEDGETAGCTGMRLALHNKELWHCDVREFASELGYTGDKEKLCPQCGGIFGVPSGRGRSSTGDPTQHYSIIFNSFVFMQLFNWLNCRKIYHEWFVLEGVSENPTFCIIWLICVLVQFLIMEALAFGKEDMELQCDSHNLAFRTTHLTTGQWMACLLIGFLSMGWQWVLIIVAIKFFPEMGKTTAASLAGTDRTTTRRDADGKAYSRGVAPDGDVDVEHAIRSVMSGSQKVSNSNKSPGKEGGD